MWHGSLLNQFQALIIDTTRAISGQTTTVGQTNPGSGTLVFGLLLAGLTFLITWAIGGPLVAWLRYKKIGKQIRDEGPETHLKKTGTPTMGGLMMSVSILFVTIAFILIPLVVTTGKGLAVLLPIGIVLACGTLGAFDDLLTLVGKRMPPVETPVAPPVGETRQERRKRKKLNAYGLAGRFKMAWLLGISAVAALILYFPLDLRKVYVPFIREPVVLESWIYIPLAILFICGMSNAVNLTDGLDTLAASTAAIAFGAYGIIGFIQLQPQVVLLAFTAAGACFGFLWYNAFPAQVFMGDTGSLTLGALLAVLAFQTNQWLLLPLIGGVFVAEAVSVMLQVSWFKYTRRKYGEGRRFFKMSPLHNHFELSGWSETQTSMRFWLFSMVLALVGVALALIGQ
jgi:phospho-N-acetylmuramoyl-pentapeptide-transferase